MEMLQKVFPYSLNVKEKDVASLVVSIIIYLVLALVVGIAIWIVGLIPIVNILGGILGTIVELYCLVGIILAVLKYLNVLK